MDEETSVLRVIEKQIFISHSVQGRTNLYYLDTEGNLLQVPPSSSPVLPRSSLGEGLYKPEQGHRCFPFI